MSNDIEPEYRGPIDLDFDDAEKVGNEANQFGIEMHTATEVVPKKLTVIQQTNPISHLVPANVQVQHLTLDWHDMQILICLILDEFHGNFVLIETVREYLQRYAKAHDDAPQGLSLLLRGSFSIEGTILQKALKVLCTSLSSRPATARKRNVSAEYLTDLECQIAITRCVLMLFKLIAIYEDWPGAGTKWLIWFNRFHKYYTIVKGA